MPQQCIAVHRCLCVETHGIAVEELASHTHGASCSTTSLTGYADTSSNYGPFDNTTGIFGHGNSTNLIVGSNGSNYTVYQDLTIDASHSHNITINATGNSKAHENRMPYIVVNRWKRTA